MYSLDGYTRVLAAGPNPTTNWLMLQLAHVQTYTHSSRQTWPYQQIARTKVHIMAYGDSVSRGPSALQDDLSQLFESVFVTGVFLFGQQLQRLLELMECDLPSETNNKKQQMI